jgi:hypothetical protein
MKQTLAFCFLLYLLFCGIGKNVEWIWRGTDWLNEKVKDWLWDKHVRRGKG